MKSMNSKSPRIPQLRPRIARFEKLTYGLFVHFSFYSQLGQGGWIRCLGKQPPAKYDKLKDTFTARDFKARPSQTHRRLWSVALPPASWHILRFQA
jgi:hypothetical protein